MEEITRSVCADCECELMEFNREDNHSHLLVNIPPKVTVTKEKRDCGRLPTRPSPPAPCLTFVHRG